MSATKRNSSSSSTTTTSSSKVCCFCNLTEDNELDFGKFCEKDGIFTHYYCLLLSSNMEQRGNDDEGILGFLTDDIHKELRRGRKLVCSYCKKIGATLGCCNTKCKRIFHLPCGLKAGSLHQFFGEFKSFCINHRPKQKIDEYVLNQLGTLHDILCYICYDKANPRDLIDTLWAPCCKKEAWFHRKCVQQLALSAGYFFKCPLCNNKKDFQSAMLLCGIFIPSQDASWELVPNAFEELLYRHDQCDATLCLCPKGRKHTSSNAKWELVLCRICGSQGIHMACGKLKWANPAWECVECTSILRKVQDHNSAKAGDNSDSSSLSRGSNSDESDSDVSVGTDLPVMCSNPTSSFTLLNRIKSRPGPRSFKLQQQLKACNLLDSLIDTSCAPAFLSTADTKSTINKVNKENNSAQESKANDSQETGKKDHGKQEKKTSGNDVKSQSNSNEKVIITIESDDDDDVEIISLKRKITIPTVQIAWANMFGPSKDPVNSSGTTADSAGKSTNETDPLQVENTVRSSAMETLKKRDSATESNVLKPQVSSSSKIITSKIPDATAPQEPAQVAASSSNDNLEASVTDINSIMNIKITNVTSLPPEVFANVPEVGLAGDVTWLQPDDVGTSSTVGKPLEQWFVAQKSPSITMKRSIHEEANNAADNSCKKIKGNSSDKTDTVASDTGWEQNKKIEAEPNTEVHKVVEDTAKCKTTSKTFDLALRISQNHDISVKPVTRKSDAVHATVKSSHHLKKSNGALPIVQHSSESSSVKLYTPVIHSDGQIYYPISSGNVIYTQPVSSQASPATQSTAVPYATTSSEVTRPAIIQNTIKNHQSIAMALPMSADAINTSNNQQIGGSNKQQTGLAKEKTAEIPTADSGSSSRIVCDGDAGRTNPAVTPTRPAYFSEAANTAGTAADTSGAVETTGAEVGQKRDSPRFTGVRKSSKRPVLDESDSVHIMSVVSRIRSFETQCSIFPQVTNNHNACHQPRLIPQYMHLHDLKFRVCGTNNIQMTLYDTFSVNIPVKNLKATKIRRGVATRESEGRLPTFQTQCETSSNLDHGDSLASGLTKGVADATAVVAHDEAKENLDPVSRTACNVFSGNVSLMNGVENEDATTSDEQQREHNVQARLSPNDTNSDALDRALCHTIVDSNTRRDDDHRQGPRVNYWKGVQLRQSTPVTEESIWLPYRPTMYSINSDLNIIHTKKNIEKLLRNNVTVMMKQRVDDKKIDGSRATDNSSTTRPHFPHATANHSDSRSHSTHSDQTDVSKSQTRDQSVTSAPNIMFNERSISNKQIDACDSSQLIRCMKFCDDDERTHNNDPTLRVSIDLHKIQNLIEAKPKLFVSDDDDVDIDGDVNVESDSDDDRCRTFISQPRSENDCTQQQAKFRDTKNDGRKSSPFENCELQTLDQTTMEGIEARDSLYVNTINRYGKRERETRHFDKRNR